MPLSETQILIALVIALFPGIMALLLGTALSDA
ncbi:MAG: photosystem I reaction center subunit XII [Pseudanabaenaceae cyanobacterium bins.68]|nr:photosystem I reaction center subunit XII [Pseudanabaenaceae cyanobacterium bins.68]